MQYEIVFAYLIIIFITLLPILSWKKTRPSAPLMGIFYLLFIYIYRDFVSAKITASHDTYWGYTYFYSLVRQWIVSDASFGWNPYLGGGQPLSLFSNYFLHAPVLIFAKLFVLLKWDFSHEQFFSLIWVLNHLSICTGMYLLLYLLLESLTPAIFGMATLLFGGLFPAELASPNGYYILIFLPYLLFSIILFWKYKKWFGMYAFSALLGLTVNYNNPAYVFICLLALLFSYLLLNIGNIREIVGNFFGLIKEKPYGCVIAIILFIIPASPFVYSYIEMADYVSPTRGFTVRGQTVSNTGFQAPAAAPLESYKVLYDWNINDFFLNTHTSFYIGFLPCILLFVAVFLLFRSAEFRKNIGLFAISVVSLALIGAGNFSPIPVWSWLKSLPFLNVVRHTFQFARAVAFILIIISSAALLQLLKTETFFWSNVKTRIPLPAVALFALLALHLGSLIYFSNMRIHDLPVNAGTVATKDGIRLLEFIYPSEWSLYGKKSSPIPFDLTGMIQKKSILTHPDPEFNFMLHKDFIPFLRDISREDYYYYNGFFVRPPEYQPCKTNLLLPPIAVNSDTALYNTSLGFRKKNTYSPVYATVESNSAEDTAKNLYKAIDGDFNSYWQVNKAKNMGSLIWLSITFPSEIKIFGIRITPHKLDELWSNNKAEIQISRDGKRWDFLQKLDLRNAIVNNSIPSFLFPFNSAVTARFFRLRVDDEKFASLAEIEFVDEPITNAFLIEPYQKIAALNISGMVVKASSHYQAHTEDLAFDGNVNTFWHVNLPAEDSHWISTVFPASQTFNAVEFTPRQDEYQMWDSFRESETKVELQISTDGKSWKSIPQERSAYGKTFLLYFKEKITAKYVRFLIRDKSRKFLSVAEIQFLRLPEGYFKEVFSPSEKIGTVKPLESYNPNKVYLNVHAEKDGNLVRLENYHHGWKAYIDGKEVAMQKFGPNLQLIPIPAGKHGVHLEFYSWYNVLVWLHVLFFLFAFLWFIIYLVKCEE